MSQRKSVITGGALELPIFKKLAGRRVILASSSPRRKDILAKLGVQPEIIPSTFAENLPKSTFSGRLADYPIATAAEKGIEVYERLVRENDRDPPDLVISADTVVIFPPERDTADGERAHGETSEILEKPINEEEQTRNLLSMSGRRAEIVTGVTIVYPTVEAPGYKLESISASTLAYFHSDQEEIIQAYVKCGEGIDRAGGFAYQGLGGILIEKIEGDFDNSAGFPSTAFWRWMSELDSAGVFDDAWAS